MKVSGLLRNRTILVAVASFAGGLAGSQMLGSVSFVSVVLAAFAAVGVFAAASGLARLLRGGDRGMADLGRIALLASSDAMAVVEDGDRILEANPAFLRLSRSRMSEAPTPERFLRRIPGSGGPLSEMLRAVAQETSATRAFAFDAGPGGRSLQVSVHPLDGPRRVLWALTLMGRERDGAASLELEHEPEGPAEARTPPLAMWEEAPVGVVRLSAERATTANATLARALGYGLADWGAEGIALAELVAPDDIGRVRAALGSGSATPATLDVTLTCHDASPFAAWMRMGPVDRRGEATAIVLPRAAAPAALPEAALPEATVAALAGGGASVPAPVPALDAPAPPIAGEGPQGGHLLFVRSPLAMAEVDGAGRVAEANGAFGRLFAGQEGADLTGRPLRSLVSERDGEGVDRLLDEARQAGAPGAPREVSIPGEGGRSARLYAASLGSGTAIYAVDTTAQRALEAQFAQSQKMHAVGQLAGGVAHDFNNVLTAIIGYCDLLLASHRPSDPSFPDIMQIKQNANRAAGLVRQLLAFSRRQTLRPQVIELTDVISDLSQMLRRLIGETITLEVQHARDLWPVKVDVNQLEQVILNLVVNARDAMPDGGTLTLSTANVPASACASYGAGGPAPADYVLIEVSDTGTGIAPEIMDKIFEPFFSTKEVGKGTGLGLSTVYGIVQQTGGTIQAASEPGKGSTFRVFLPRHVATAEDPKPRIQEAEARPADLTGQGTVLLVEDEDAVRAFAARALSARGYNVVAAASGAEALAVMDKADTRIDLVVSDVVMPEMDGPTLLRELRARDPGLKVIFISGYAEEAFARNLPPSEKFAFLPKPFSLKQLVAAVKDAIRS